MNGGTTCEEVATGNRSHDLQGGKKGQGMPAARHQPLQNIAYTAAVHSGRFNSCKGGRSAKGGKHPPVPICHSRPKSSGWVSSAWCSQLPPPPPYPAPSRRSCKVKAPAAHGKARKKLQATCAASTSASSVSSVNDCTPLQPLKPSGTAAVHDTESMCMRLGTQLEIANRQDGELERGDSDLTMKLKNDESREAAISALTGQVRDLSFDSDGCRVVQLALEVANPKRAAVLAVELRGHIYSAVTSPHANFVVQKIIEVLPMESCGFVAEELLGTGRQVARHRYACRILCRLIEHHDGGVNADKCTESLINEIMDNINDLCRNNFGHHVVNSVIENGQPSQRSKIAMAIQTDIFGLAKNRNASYVIGRALSYCDALEKRILVNELLGGPEGLVPLAWSQYGCCVVRALLRMPTEYSQAGFAQLESAATDLRQSKYGRRLLEEFNIAPQEGHARTAEKDPEV